MHKRRLDAYASTFFMVYVQQYALCTEQCTLHTPLHQHISICSRLCSFICCFIFVFIITLVALFLDVSSIICIICDAVDVCKYSGMSTHIRSPDTLFLSFLFFMRCFFSLLFNVISVKCFFSLFDRSSYVCLFIYFFSMKHLHVNAYFYDFYWSQCVKTVFFCLFFLHFCVYI